jgi:chromosomal replication initiator protein
MQKFFLPLKMAKPYTETLWRDILENIKISVSPAIFSTWFSQTHLAKVDKGPKRSTVTVGCNSSYVKSTIESRYFGLMQDTISEALEHPCDLVFVVKQNPQKSGAKEGLSAPLFEQENTNFNDLETFKKASIRSHLTFENFAVSSSNQMAWAAAEAVSKNPGNAYNPLFVWGGVGVGKTHLMNAVGHSMLEKEPDAKIFFCTGEEFTNDIVEGIRNKTTQVFRNKYRKLDALLVDDIQFIAGKDAVQEEFFHTFNAVTGAGGQVILTSDKPPSDISRLEERLRSRFEAGLIVDISPPDFELRCAILQIKAKERGIDLAMPLVQMVAGNIDSARKIEGFLIRLASEARLKNTEITEDLIASILGKGIETNGQPVKASPTDFISSVSKYYSVGKRALLGISRARPIARPRQILMYLLRTQLQLPLEEIGRIVGGRDHTTVMHAVEKISQLLSTDVQIRQDIVGIKNML